MFLHDSNILVNDAGPMTRTWDLFLILRTHWNGHTTRNHLRIIIPDEPLASIKIVQLDFF